MIDVWDANIKQDAIPTAITYNYLHSMLDEYHRNRLDKIPQSLSDTEYGIVKLAANIVHKEYMRIQYPDHR